MRLLKAIAGNAKLLPIDNVSVKSSDAARVLGLITKDFNEEEAQGASHFTRWKHPFAAAQREKVPIEIEAYYRASEKTSRGAWTTSYVEAVRSFPAGSKDKGCGLITFAGAGSHNKGASVSIRWPIRPCLSSRCR